jgi:hypothetical protein
MRIAAMVFEVASRRATNTRGLNPHVRTRSQSTASGGPTHNPARVRLWGLYGASLAATAYYLYQVHVKRTAVVQRVASYPSVPLNQISKPDFIGKL